MAVDKTNWFSAESRYDPAILGAGGVPWTRIHLEVCRGVTAENSSLAPMSGKVLEAFLSVQETYRNLPPGHYLHIPDEYFD